MARALGRFPSTRVKQVVYIRVFSLLIAMNLSCMLAVVILYSNITRFFFFIFLNTQLYVYKLASYWETMRCSRRVQLACHVPTSGHDGMVLNNHHHQLWAVAGIHPSISDDHGSACNVKGRPAERICMHASPCML